MDHKIHIDAIRKGRDYGEVLDLYMESCSLPSGKLNLIPMTLKPSSLTQWRLPPTQST